MTICAMRVCYAFPLACVLAVAGFAVDRMMSSRAGNRNMLSFAPHYTVIARF